VVELNHATTTPAGPSASAFPSSTEEGAILSAARDQRQTSVQQTTA
jgi:hypothetical protein